MIQNINKTVDPSATLCTKELMFSSFMVLDLCAVCQLTLLIPDKTELPRIRVTLWLKRNIFGNKCSPCILFQCEDEINNDPQTSVNTLLPKQTMIEAEPVHIYGLEILQT